MPTNQPEQQKYDPWELQQDIVNFKITIHCSRYWMLSEWECKKMSFPFWRLYHSRLGGAYVSFEGKTTEIAPGKLILIPPYTAFSSHLKGTEPNETIKGVRIQHEDEVAYYGQSGFTDQLFVHFNLGYPFDHVENNIYEIPVGAIHTTMIQKIEADRLSSPNTIDFQSNIQIISLVLAALQHTPSELWKLPETDRRILKTIYHIDNNLYNKLDNNELSKIANLATNSFARLFKENMRIPVQQYIRQRRIDQATILLHHSDLSIDDISTKCGFYDRHHFSRIFREQTGIAPGLYRQKMKETSNF